MTTAQRASLQKIWMLKKIAPQIEEMSVSFSFDWNLASSLLASELGVDSFSIEPGRQEWLSADRLGYGLGPSLSVFPIDIAPLSGSVYWIMPQQEVKKLTSWMLSKTAEPLKISSHLLEEGFYQYLLLKTLDAIFQMEPLQTLSPLLQTEGALPDEKAFCIDIALQFHGKMCHGRLAISQELKARWKEHAERLKTSFVSPALAQSIELSLGLKTGSVLLKQSQWEQIKLGDFILLDEGSYDPRHLTGISSLCLGSTPLFQVQIEKNKIQLLQFASIYEDATDMTIDNFPEEENFSESREPTSEKEAELVSIKETSLSLTVELTRLKMTLERLLQLNPGDTFELPLQPDQNVTLSVNGQKVASAELVYLGEQLGLRIIELG